MKNKITQAVILSAGLGTRLRPLTNKIPKVMVPLEGRPLLEYHFRLFKKHGLKEFFVNLHYLPKAITDYFGTGRKLGIKIHYFFEPKLLGTAGGIKSFAPKLNQVFFVVYGDIFSLVDYSKMAEAFFQKKQALGLELVGKSSHAHDSDLVKLNKAEKFLKVYLKPHQKLPIEYLAMKGIYILRKEIIKYVPAKTYYEIDHQLIPKILKLGKNFYGFKTNDYLLDIGTMERCQKAKKYVLKNKPFDF